MIDAMADGKRVRLLDVDSDIGLYLTAEERSAADALTVPCVALDPGPLDVRALLERTVSFGAFVVEGMLASHLRVGEQAGMRILGPGDVVSTDTVPASMLLVDSGCRVVAPSRLAMLGRDVLVGAHRWPRLIAGLHARAAAQIERVAVQLAICQLPRVEDRLLALLWLLAESWGRVTPNGTVLPLGLTHETLGALVGARRPTVTLALGELSDRGAVLRQGRTWLLVEPFPVASRGSRAPLAPTVVADDPSPWGGRESTPEAHVVSQEMSATVHRLHEQHLAIEAAIKVGLERTRAARQRSEELRETARFVRELRSPRAP
jgi:CRP/FNR family transcriptional regulator, cyclic AMP receptor protein